MLHLIFGGVHLDGRKEGTRRKPLCTLEVEPERVVIPLNMHVGAPCQPQVAVGDTVCVGQPIGASQEGMLIHAGISGQVEEIGLRPHPWGEAEQAVIIRNDHKQTRWAECGQGCDDYESLAPEEIIHRIRQAGVVGMGGGGYPTADKLQQARGRADVLIINAAESEPYVTADHRLLLERGEGVLVGLRLLMKAVEAADAVVAVEGNKLNAAEVLERTAKRLKLAGRVCAVPSRYPLGAEKQVIKAVTGREVPPGKAAVDVGCVVFNAATAFAVYEAVVKGLPLTHRAVTVTGAAVVRPRNLWVPVGTPMSELVKAAGGFKEKPELMLVGGPMMGLEQKDLNAPVIKSMNSLICMLDWELDRPQTERECIRCGRCVSVCPMHLMPILVNKELGLGADVHELRRLHTRDCLGCGCCSYVCPSHIPLVERMKQADQIVEREKADREVTP